MEIMITCYAENAGSIGAGLSDVESVDFDDLSWLYEGASESYWENYRDFEDAVRKAAEKVCSDVKGKESPHKEELEALAYEAIKVELGEITAVCEIDGHEKTLLGITDNSFESFYQKLLESGPGNYYFLRFGSERPVLVAMPMQQEPPRYDKDGLLINPSLRFVRVPRDALGNWRSDDWGRIEAEFASDKTIILSRNNMPSAVKYVDKVTGNTSDIVW